MDIQYVYAFNIHGLGKCYQIQSEFSDVNIT